MGKEKVVSSVTVIYDPVVSFIHPGDNIHQSSDVLLSTELSESQRCKQTLAKDVPNIYYMYLYHIFVLSSVKSHKRISHVNRPSFFSIGRGNQLNCGVKEACGENVLFLHADTRLPPRFDQHILITLGEPGVAAGAFKFGLDVLHDTRLV